jgi:hypothetical protein
MPRDHPYEVVNQDRDVLTSNPTSEALNAGGGIDWEYSPKSVCGRSTCFVISNFLLLSLCFIAGWALRSASLSDFAMTDPAPTRGQDVNRAYRPLREHGSPCQHG